MIEDASAHSPESINISMSTSVFHVYAGAPDCTKEYLGTISIANEIREIRVAADRMAVLSLSVFAPETYGTTTCKLEVGFVPASGETYRLIVRDNFRKKCALGLLYANGEPVPAIDWRDCEPR